MRARYYQPSVGRFNSEDPVWGVNLYPYGENNSILNIDPDGNLAWNYGKSNRNLKSSFEDIQSNITRYSLVPKEWLCKKENFESAKLFTKLKNYYESDGTEIKFDIETVYDDLKLKAKNEVVKGQYTEALKQIDLKIKEKSIDLSNPATLDKARFIRTLIDATNTQSNAANGGTGLSAHHMNDMSAFINQYLQ